MAVHQVKAGNYTLDATEDVIIGPEESYVFEVDKGGRVPMVVWVVVMQEGRVQVTPEPTLGEHTIGNSFLSLAQTEWVREAVEMPASCKSCLTEDQQWLSLPAILVEDTPQLLHGKRTLLFAEELNLCE